MLSVNSSFADCVIKNNVDCEKTFKIVILIVLSSYIRIPLTCSHHPYSDSPTVFSLQGKQFSSVLIQLSVALNSFSFALLVFATKNKTHPSKIRLTVLLISPIK